MYMDSNYFKNKINTGVNSIIKDNDKDFLPSLANFFDFLCEDFVIRTMLGQIIQQINEPEAFLKEYVTDLSLLLNEFTFICADKIEKDGKWEDLLRLEGSVKDQNEMLPSTIRIGRKLERRHFYVTENIEIVLARFKGLDRVIKNFKVDIDELSKIVEHNYHDWNKTNKGYLKLVQFNVFDSTEVTVSNKAWEELKKLVGLLEIVYQPIIQINKLKPRTDLLEIMSFINYNYPYLPNIKVLVENNQDFIEFGRKQHKEEVVLKSQKGDFCYKEWEHKLNRIINKLFNLLDSTWYVKSILDRYHLKIREYGWARLKRLSAEGVTAVGEKFLQLDLAEYLFDNGISSIIEKTTGNDRLDIVTTDDSKLIIEVKLLKTVDDLPHVLQGFTQILKYLGSHAKVVGYYVIFQACETQALEIIKEFTIGGTTIFVLVIDITGISGREDKRERVDFNDNEIRNYVTSKDKGFIKSWNNIMLSDLLLIDNVGIISAMKIMSNKENIRNFDDMKKIPNIQKRQIREMEKHITF
ncbi:hypothetical protein COF09_11170 [Bacillus toyonensis]|uniref:hypothetical protein n=1 Tax=Bacillus toyonensis TaxID=155322 RepID=UPI000BFC0515|nr:hypothetical protein [Bacillus toyonensis]PHC43816.1 hypothetical protein COF09_11170 [Bacillus toyonensis]